MDRKIIFRGKRIDNGEWVKGDLLTRRNAVSSESAIIFFDDEHIIPRSPAVDFETVGQYTGLKDKNGKLIFEGDIVKVRDPYNGCWSVNGGEVIFSTEYVGGWVVTSNGSDGLNLGTRQNHIEIIGNVHDSPELLEVQ